MANVAAATMEGWTSVSRRDAIVETAAALRAQHLQLQAALQSLRMDLQRDPVQRDLLAYFETKGREMSMTVTSTIQLTDRLLEALPHPPESP